LGITLICFGRFPEVKVLRETNSCPDSVRATGLSQAGGDFGRGRPHCYIWIGRFAGADVAAADRKNLSDRGPMLTGQLLIASLLTRVVALLPSTPRGTKLVAATQIWLLALQRLPALLPGNCAGSQLTIAASTAGSNVQRSGTRDYVQHCVIEEANAIAGNDPRCDRRYLYRKWLHATLQFRVSFSAKRVAFPLPIRKKVAGARTRLPHSSFSIVDDHIQNAGGNLRLLRISAERMSITGGLR